MIPFVQKQLVDIEYIVIDGGSTDGTLEILESVDFIDILISEHDDGFPYALAKGLKLSSGNIMGWLNAGDTYVKGALKIVSDIFRDNSIGIDIEWITSRYNLTSDEFGNLLKFTDTKGFSSKRFLSGAYCSALKSSYGHSLQQESTFWRRELWDRIGGDLPSYSIACDYALWLEFSRSSELFCVDLPLAFFAQHNGQLSTSSSLYSTNLLDLHTSFISRYKLHPTPH